jgi:hypothetical protein
MPAINVSFIEAFCRFLIQLVLLFIPKEGRHRSVDPVTVPQTPPSLNPIANRSVDFFQ